MENKPLLDDNDLAKLTKRSVGAVRKDRRTGKGVPYLKLGACVRYRPEDVEVYLENCRVKAAEK